MQAIFFNNSRTAFPLRQTPRSTYETSVCGFFHNAKSGHNYVNRILGQLVSLSYTADINPFSRYAIAKAIHPKAKTMSIINHKWTEVFHAAGNFVFVDRIIPSKMLIK